MTAAIRTAEPVVVYQGVACPHCSRPLVEGAVVTGANACPRCRRRFDAVRFSPRVGEPRVLPVASQGATACGVHRRNAALGHCDRCGIFLCGLCRVSADDRTLCAACFSRLVSEDALDSARTSFTDWGARASSTAVAGLLLCFPLGPFLGLLALYYGVRGLRQRQGTLAGRGGILLAMVLGLLEVTLPFVVYLPIFFTD